MALDSLNLVGTPSVLALKDLFSYAELEAHHRTISIRNALNSGLIELNVIRIIILIFHALYIYVSGIHLPLNIAGKPPPTKEKRTMTWHLPPSKSEKTLLPLVPHFTVLKKHL